MIPTTIYPAESLIARGEEQTAQALHIVTYFRECIGFGVLASLGARKLRAVPGVDKMGGLLFLATILPMTDNGRGSNAHPMAVMVSLTVADLIDVDVREVANGREHARIAEITIGDLGAVLLALDYDGDTVLNPRYWSGF